jgi:hypothetical protein
MPRGPRTDGQAGAGVQAASRDPATGPAGPAGAAPAQPRRILGLSPVGLVIAAATVLAVALRAYQLARPGHLLAATEYDDGADFGSALQLVSGVIPYRDFITVQPPGITILMAPAALLAKLTGTDWAMAVGRILTAAAGAAAVPLAGRLARHRGLAAVTVACGLLAVFPSSAHTVLLEPWLVLACLAGLLAIFDGDQLAGRRRLAWGGAALGFAGAVKVWAIVPVLVILVLCLPGTRRLLACLGGVAAGFLIPVLPFLAASPARFYQSVIVAQLVRTGPRTPLGYRVQEMTGLTGGSPGTVVLAIAGTLAVLLAGGGFVAAWRVTGRRPPPLDMFAAVTTVLVTGVFLSPADFDYHDAAFLAPFAGLSLGLSAATLLDTRRNPALARLSRPRLDRLRAGVIGGAGLVMLVLPLAVPWAENAPNPVYPRAALEQAIPAGACVLTDQASLLIAINRFSSAEPGCNPLVDATGTNFVLGQGKTGLAAATVPAAREFWNHAFRSAQYVLITPYNFVRIPWTPAIVRYFDRNFTPVESSDWLPLLLYTRHAPGPSA